MACTHVDQIKDVQPQTPNGCGDCLQSGDSWVSLRMCLTCGHVGCCDSSANKHATAHYKKTGHPIMELYGDPNRTFRWCYIDEIVVA